jgi:hypothetical protein
MLSGFQNASKIPELRRGCSLRSRCWRYGSVFTYHSGNRRQALAATLSKSKERFSDFSIFFRRRPEQFSVFPGYHALHQRVHYSSVADGGFLY